VLRSLCLSSVVLVICQPIAEHQPLHYGLQRVCLRGRLIGEVICLDTDSTMCLSYNRYNICKVRLFLRNPFFICHGKMDFRGIWLCLSQLSICFCSFEPVFEFNLVWNWFDLAGPKACPFQFLAISINMAHWRTDEVGGRWLHLTFKNPASYI